MQHKRILGALALVLSLCFISSAMVIDNNESGQEIVLSAPDPEEPLFDTSISYIICIGDTEHRYDDAHYVSSTYDTILDGIFSNEEYNSLVKQGYAFEYRRGSKTGDLIDFNTIVADSGIPYILEVYVIASLPPGTLSDDGTRLIQAPSNATEFTIPESVNTIAGYAFFKCKDLKSITFPESVKTLEPHTFDGLGQDITVNIPYSATYMDQVPPFFNIVRTGTPTLTYTVTFNTNGGSAVASQTVAIDSAAVKPADPTKDNLMFMGWYSDAELTSKYNFNSQVSANITLYAKWAERTYPAPTADNYSSSDKFEIYTADEMVDFRKSIDSTRHYDGKIVYLARDIEMSGVHYDFPDTFNGTFDGQGHVISGFTSQMSSPLFRIIGSNGIVKNLGIFNAQVSSEGDSNAIMAEVNNGTIVNCYANECSVSWGGIDSGGAGFVCSNYGSIENCYSNTSCLKNYNTLCAGNNGTITNSYYLQGSRQPNEIGVAKTAEEMKDPSFATMLGNAYAPDTENVNNGYPVFAPVSAEFTVEFNSNGGSDVSAQAVKEGENAVRPADPTKQGYVFGGWYVDAALTNEYTFTTAVSSNITLYAKWYENLVFTSVPSISDIKITIDGRTISASVAADHYLYILWDLGNGETIKTYSNKLSYTYADDGEYIIKATAINSEGSSETVEYNVNIENNKEQELQSLFIALILFAVILIVAFILIFYITGMFIVSTIISPIIAIVIVSVLWFLGAL